MRDRRESVAVIIAVGVNTDGRREVLGMTVGHREAEPFWVEFLRSLARRGLRGAKLVTSDAHEGLKAAITKVLSATWQRCRKIHVRDYPVGDDEKVDLDKWPTQVEPAYKSEDDYKILLAQHVHDLARLQNLHYASDRYAILLIFQAMDAAGKDGTIRHVRH